MGNSKSKKVTEPDKFFDRERWKEQKRKEAKKKKLSHSNKRVAVPVTPLAQPPGPGPAPVPAPARSFDREAIDRMRYQLQNDADAFLLNNILLCVQFFENYEREIQHIKDNPIGEREHDIDEAMVRDHKHVFFADRLQECVHEHVRFSRRRGQVEAMVSPRLFVIYDNVEASEPGDTSDYSAVLDAPFYKLRVEDCKEPGYIKLKKLEVLESALKNEEESMQSTAVYKESISEDSIYTDSNDSDDSPYASKGVALLEKIKTRLNEPRADEKHIKPKNLKLNDKIVDVSGRRRSGPVKQISLQVEKSNIKNLNNIRSVNTPLPEIKQDEKEDNEIKSRKSILKTTETEILSGPLRETNKTQIKDTSKSFAEAAISEDTETSGYRSTSSSRQNESEAESDYGYSTITESATPKPVELSLQSNFSVRSGVLADECWTVVQVRTVDWSDDDDEDVAEGTSGDSIPRNLFDTCHYLSSASFMTNFVDNFMMKLGTGLELAQDAINNATTQGASIYCDSLKSDVKTSYEVIPAVIAAWPNAANQWIIRERRIIQNPRTNFSYQWPTKYMVSKAIGFGCLLVPIGYRPKRGRNPEEKLQWRIIFPAAERYLQSCLAHSHIRCYLFTLALHRAFLDNASSKIGIDASHIKNHLFWQCEDNYAKWPEDRLGETLRLFLKSFYVHFGHSKLPNYFMDNCNDFKSIPKPMLLKLQRKLADILEAPVMHVLSALEKLKYQPNKEYYPAFNAKKLYHILTTKNLLLVLNPYLPVTKSINDESSDSEIEQEKQTSFWEREKAQDKHYQWKKERQRQMQERRKAFQFAKKQKSSEKTEVEINNNIILPKKLEGERRRLVLEFFIPHFIAMARSSEKFESIKQAVIYLEQAHRLCILLREEPSGETAANEYLDVIRDKLADCQRKLVNQGGFKLPPRRKSSMSRMQQMRIRKYRPNYKNIISQNSPEVGIPAFTFVDVNSDSDASEVTRNSGLKFSNRSTNDDFDENEEESKL